MREGQFFLQKGMDFAKGDVLTRGEGDGVCGMSFGVCRMGDGVWRRHQEAAGATGAFCEKKACNLKKSGYSRRCPCRGRLSAAIH